jgi:hypothetical protein
MAATQATSGSVGWRTMRWIRSVRDRPRWVQVLPPSRERFPLAGSHPDDLGRRLEDGHGADGGHRLVVEDRLPGQAAVHRLPDAAGGRPHVDDVGVGDHRVHGGHPAAHAGGADGSRFHAGQQVRIDGGGGEAGRSSAQK